MAKFKVLIEATMPDFSKTEKWVKLEATDKKDAEKKAISAGNALFNRIARKNSKGKPDIDIISVFSGFIDKSPLSFMDSVVRAFKDSEVLFFNVVVYNDGGYREKKYKVEANSEKEAIEKVKKNYPNAKDLTFKVTKSYNAMLESGFIFTAVIKPTLKTIVKEPVRADYRQYRTIKIFAKNKANVNNYLRQRIKELNTKGNWQWEGKIIDIKKVDNFNVSSWKKQGNKVL